MRKHKKIWLAGIPVLLGALITAGAMIYTQRAKPDGPQHTPGKEVMIGGNADGGCINLGDHSELDCPGNRERNPYATETEPTGIGPWGFRVYDTVVDGTDVGLTVRRCPDESCGCAEPHCEKLGIARQDSPLFAHCQFDSGFNGNDNSTIWLKVRWPNNRGGDRSTQVSSAHDPYLGWVLKKYTTPAGHNGNVPTCA